MFLLALRRRVFALVLSASALGAIAGAGPASAQTSGTRWKVLVAIFPSTNVAHADKCNCASGDVSFTADQLKQIYAGIGDFKNDIASWSGGLGAVDVVPQLIPVKVTHLTGVVTGEDTLAPADVEMLLKPYIDTGAWDSVIAVWHPGMISSTNYSYLGPVILASSPGHPFTWSTVLGDTVGNYGPQQPIGEVFVHEWLHAVAGFYRSLGYSLPDSDDACLPEWAIPSVDYCPTPPTYQEFYKAVLKGTLENPTAQEVTDAIPIVAAEPMSYTGISLSVWKAGTPRASTRPSPLPVQLLSPFDDTCSPLPTLSWTAFSGTTGFRASVCPVAASSSVCDPTQSSLQITGSPNIGSYTFEDGQLDPDRLYLWSIQALSGGNASPPGDVLHFDTASSLPAPSLRPSGGALPASGFPVEISASSTDVIITYTLNGNDPTIADLAIQPGSTVNVVPVGGKVLKARAFSTRSGCQQSAVATAVYTAAQPRVVTVTDDSGDGSLRKAISDANASAGREVIAFAIPGSGVHTITPLTSLPPITDGVIIDGATQPGYAGVPLIELDGSAAAGADGLKIVAGNSVVRGLAIHGFFANGIELAGSQGSVVEGCYLGTNAAGNAALPNGSDGVYINGSANNRIGGASPGAGNVLSGNLIAGVGIELATSTGNRILGNRIGTDVAGAAKVPNRLAGVAIAEAGSNTIGGDGAGMGNVISGNGSSPGTGDGIVLLNGGATGNTIAGNKIGIAANGTTALGNGHDGILISCATGATAAAHGNRIGGTVPGAGNVISGNGNAGVEIVSAQSGGDGNVLEGNRIGTDASGSARLGNGGSGVVISGSVPGSPTPSGNVIGGIVPEARNLISGNGVDGVQIIGASVAGNVVQGNYIGTDESGSVALGNARSGVRLTTAFPTISDSAANNLIGGSAGGAGNLISGNGQSGVAIIGNVSGASGNVIAGNRIGLDANGTSALGNGTDGVIVTTALFGGAAHDNTIGGIAGGGNWIGGNAQAGVRIDGAATRNMVYGNSIGLGPERDPVGNLGDGIVLNAPGNAVGSIGFGPNEIARNQGAGVRVTAGTGSSILSNSIDGNGGVGIVLAGGNAGSSAPSITSAASSSSTTVVQASLQALASATYEIQFFASATCDPSGAGEGASYLGHVRATTAANGQAAVNARSPLLLNPGTVVTATATSLDSGSTSAFSACGTVTASGSVGNPPVLLPWSPENCGGSFNPLEKDRDGDGIGDACDDCPYYASANQTDTDGDGRGDVCECTDQNGDGRNTVADLVAINSAIFNPALVSALCDGNGDGLCNVADIIAANVEIFSPTSTSICARQPVPGP